MCLNKVRIIFDAEIDEIEYPSKPEDTKRPLNIKLKQPQTGIKKLNSVVKSHILLTATGRQANTGPLNLEKIGVDTDKSGNVRVDGSLRTSVEKIYAAGETPANGIVCDDQGRKKSRVYGLVFGSVEKI